MLPAITKAQALWICNRNAKDLFSFFQRYKHTWLQQERKIGELLPGELNSSLFCRQACRRPVGFTSSATGCPCSALGKSLVIPSAWFFAV